MCVGFQFLIHLSICNNSKPAIQNIINEKHNEHAFYIDLQVDFLELTSTTSSDLSRWKFWKILNSTVFQEDCCRFGHNRKHRCTAHEKVESKWKYSFLSFGEETRKVKNVGFFSTPRFRNIPLAVLFFFLCVKGKMRRIRRRFHDRCRVDSQQNLRVHPTRPHTVRIPENVGK